MKPEKKEINSTREITQKAYNLGYTYEKQYGACSQCAILAIMDALGNRNEDLFKAAFGFAGGVGNMSKMCGALAAGTMMISLEYGRELKKFNYSNGGREARVPAKGEESARSICEGIREHRMRKRSQ